MITTIRMSSANAFQDPDGRNIEVEAIKEGSTIKKVYPSVAEAIYQLKLSEREIYIANRYYPMPYKGYVITLNF